MKSEEREIRFYQTTTSRIPFSDWFDALPDRRTRQQIDARLARVRAGNMGDTKFVGAGVYELRVDLGPGYRIYFGQHGRRLIILLCGGDKSSQRRDIEKARLYWADYKRRTT